MGVTTADAQVKCSSANDLLQARSERCENELASLGEFLSKCTPEEETLPVELKVFGKPLAFDLFKGSSYCSHKASCLPELIPLKECILTIIWELMDYHQFVDLEDTTHQVFVRLLCFLQLCTSARFPR